MFGPDEQLDKDKGKKTSGLNDILLLFYIHKLAGKELVGF